MMVSLFISICLVVLAGIVDPAFAHGNCGTTPTSKIELDLIETKINDARKARSGIACNGCITIDTYIYVFRKSSGEGSQVNDAVIDEQMKVLNVGFAKSPFKFRLVEANYEEDDFFYSYFKTTSEKASGDYTRVLLQKWPQRGDYSALNIYYGGMADGYSFSYSPADSGRTRNPWDGVFVQIGTVPGVYSERLIGVATVHEVRNISNPSAAS
jgi:hypothetical protein